MNKKIQISASMQCAPPLNLQDSALTLAAVPIDLLHIDLMDANFVPNLALNFDQVQALAQLAPIPLDAHLMLLNPAQYLDRTIDAGASLVCFHVEACGDIAAMLKHIRSRNTKAGLAISPNTPLETLNPYLHLLDYLLVMAVEPGFSGQSFMPQTLDRLDKLSSHNIPIMVDGGIDEQNAIDCINHGATILVAGAKCIFAPNKDLKKATLSLIDTCTASAVHLCMKDPSQNNHSRDDITRPCGG